MPGNKKLKENASAPEEPMPQAEKKGLSLAWQRALLCVAAVLALCVGGHFLYQVLSPAPPPAAVTEGDPAPGEVLPPAIETHPLPESAFVREGELDGIGYAVYEDYVEITKCPTTFDRVEIPAQIEGFAVMSLGDGAFDSCSALWELKLPNTLRSIGDLCFAGCTALYSLTLPDSLHEIGDYAFYQCLSLTELHISTGLKAIGLYAFDETPFLENQTDTFVILGDGILVDYRGEGGNIALPAEVKMICGMGESEYITGLYVPQGVTRIGEYAFAGCTNLASVTLPGSVEQIGGFAFSGCSSLGQLAIPEGVRSVGDSIFAYCDNFKSVSYPASVQSIGAEQFLLTDTLESIYVAPDTYAHAYFMAGPYADKVIAETE